jgi:hypothetical protein
MSVSDHVSSQKWASPQDWLLYKQIITQLYLDQNETLREVKKYMEDNHSFFAT